MFDIVINARCSNHSSGYVTTVSVKWLQQLVYQQEINVLLCVVGCLVIPDERLRHILGVCLVLEVMSGLVDFWDSVDYSSSMQCGICKRVLKGEGGKWVIG